MKMREKKKKDWWKDSSEEEKESIEKGIKDADDKRLTPHSTVKKLYDKWL